MRAEIIISAMAIAAGAMQAHAQEPEGNGQGGKLPPTRIEQAERNSYLRDKLGDALGGAVINRTVTVLGNDFYQYFTMFWRQKDVSSHVSITVFERPTARFGSEIWVQYRQQKVFRIFLPPARAATRSIGEQAVDVVYQNIANSEVERALTRSPDLAPEEL